jgi:hypothetical protein
MSAEAVRVATFATPSHEGLLVDHFLPTFPFAPGVSLDVRIWPQECASAAYMEPGWNATMLRKLDLLIEQASGPVGSVFVHADCDVVWLGELPAFSTLGDRTLLGHDDLQGYLCAGVLIGRCSPDMANMFRRASALVRSEDAEHDQHAINAAAPQASIDLCGIPEIYSPGAVLRRQIQAWDDFPPIPPGAFAAHANWCVGVPTKDAILKKVRAMSSLS